MGDIILLEDHHPPAALGQPVSRGAPGDPRSDDYCIGFGRKSVIHSVTLPARLTPFKTGHSFKVMWMPVDGSRRTFLIDTTESSCLYDCSGGHFSRGPLGSKSKRGEIHRPRHYRGGQGG